MKNITKLLFLFLTLSLPWAVSAQCGGVNVSAFCTDSVLSYPSGTSGTGSSAPFLNDAGPGCLGSSPCPAWYYLQLDQAGDLLLYLQQFRTNGSGSDVDFACWGPFPDQDVQTFLNNLCGGTYSLFSTGSLGSHRPGGGSHANGNTGGYPEGANPSNPNIIPMVDCSFDAATTEWCFIPNGRWGDIYLILITNYSQQPGHIEFSKVQTSTATGPMAGYEGNGTTNCSLMTLESNAPICEGQPLILSYSAASGFSNSAQFHWTGPNGFSRTITGPAAGGQIEIPNATVNHSGQYKLVITDGGSTYPAVYTGSPVEINPIPEITSSIQDEHTFCEGENVSLQIDIANYDFGWFTINGGAEFMAQTGDWSAGDFEIHEDTSFIIKIRAGQNCTKTDTLTFRCARTSSGLIEEQICVGNNYNNYGFTLPVQNAPLDTLLQATYVNAAGCDSTAQVLLHVTTNPIIEEIQNDVEHCGRQDGNLIVSVTQGTEPLQYTWSPDVAPLQRDSLLNIHGGTYQLDVVDSFGCRDSHTFEVVALPNPVACFTLTPESPSYLVGENIVFNNCSQYQDYNHWDMGDNNTFDTYGVSYTYNEIGAYTISLEVTDEAGCTDRTEKLIEVHEKMRFYLPNSFTPNGDGVNDVFLPVQMEVKDGSYSMIIYDRWGGLVFKTQDLNIGWDGKVNGKLVEKGSMFTYFATYKDFDNQVYEKNGTVTVLY